MCVALLHGKDGVPAHGQDDCDDSDYSAIVSVRNYSHPAQLVFDVSSPYRYSVTTISSSFTPSMGKDKTTFDNSC